MLQGLTPWGHRFYSYHLRGKAFGLRAGEVWGSMKPYAPQYRWGQFRRDWGITTRAWRQSERIKFVPRRAIPSENLYVPAKMKFPERYQTRVRLWGRDLVSGEKISRHVTVRHDTRLSRYELEQEAIKMGQETSPKLQVDRAMLVFGFVKGVLYGS